MQRFTSRLNFEASLTTHSYYLYDPFTGVCSPSFSDTLSSLWNSSHLFCSRQLPSHRDDPQSSPPLLLSFIVPVAQGYLNLLVHLIFPSLKTTLNFQTSDSDTASCFSSKSCGNLGTATAEVLHRLTGTINKHLIPFKNNKRHLRDARAQQASA